MQRSVGIVTKVLAGASASLPIIVPFMLVPIDSEARRALC